MELDRRQARTTSRDRGQHGRERHRARHLWHFGVGELGPSSLLQGIKADQQLPEAICIRLIQGIFGGAVGVVSLLAEQRLLYS